MIQSCSTLSLDFHSMVESWHEKFQGNKLRLMMQTGVLLEVYWAEREIDFDFSQQKAILHAVQIWTSDQHQAAIRLKMQGVAV